MKDILQKIYDKASIKSSRTKQIIKHIGRSFLIDIGSVIANILLVPLTIIYLNGENYGIWLTVTFFLAWFSFFNIAMGNACKIYGLPYQSFYLCCGTKYWITYGRFTIQMPINLLFGLNLKHKTTRLQ